MKFFDIPLPQPSFKRIVQQLLNSGALTSNKNLAKLDIIYAGRELLNKGKDNPLDIAYLNDHEREKFLIQKIVIDNQTKLVDTKGTIVDTKDYTSKFGDGLAAYAICPEGKFYIHEHINIGNYHPSKKELFFHSSFFSGKPGICFGMIKINEGKITYIDNRSGHYKPTKKHLINAVKNLQDYFSEDANIFYRESLDGSQDFDLNGLFFDVSIEDPSAMTVKTFLEESENLSTQVCWM